ncbi:MAG TPA: MaoC/PaaZ C-terminal domain-containing protein [Chloroflexia bacterium]|nr:MaoC/PaaZ C-terminal domain-containing protein [Chloroflexia bacterium]
MSTEFEAVAVQAKVFFEDVEVGQELPVLKNPPVTHGQLVRYSGASGDFNPIHTDTEAAVKFGLGGTIAHGMLIMGFLGHLISDYLGGPAPLKKFGVRFMSMTRPGEAIICSGTITNKYRQDGQNFIEATITAKNEVGDIKAAGSFTAVLPSRQV